MWPPVSRHVIRSEAKNPGRNDDICRKIRAFRRGKSMWASPPTGVFWFGVWNIAERQERRFLPENIGTFLFRAGLSLQPLIRLTFVRHLPSGEGALVRRAAEDAAPYRVLRARRERRMFLPVQPSVVGTSGAKTGCACAGST